MEKVTHFFLGANSGSGFQSLYQQLKDPEHTRDLIILKGGPGVGKSSFIRTIGKAMEAEGLGVEYIHCSGDPDSLDGLRIPEKGFAVVDGTAPHVLEPEYPAAVDRYLDLGRFYDVQALKGQRQQILQRCKAYRKAYEAAFRGMGAAAALREDRAERLLPALDREKLQRRTQGILRRELKKRKGPAGTLQYRFLNSWTHQGQIFFWDSVKTLCPRVYELVDHYGFADLLLQPIKEAALAAGYDVIAAPDPERPRKLQHLLLPQLGLAFVTCPQRDRGGSAYRRVRIDAMLDARKLQELKPYLRKTGKVLAVLEEQVVADLRWAKQQHDLLEEIYNPHVDFDGVYALAREEIRRLKG